MNNMLGYLRDYKRESVLAPLFKMLEATFDLFVPLVMADIVNVGIAAHDLHYILVRCGILLVLAVIGLTCSLTAQYFSAKAANPATSPSFISETSSFIYAPHSGPKVRCEMVFLASATVPQTSPVLSLR